MNQVITIWIKELRDTLRDKRTLMSMILMPLVMMPLLIVGLTKLIEYQQSQAQEQTVKIVIENEEKTLSEIIKKQSKIEIVSIENDLTEAIRQDQIEAAIILPQDFNQSLENLQPVSIRVLSESTDQKSTIAIARINTALSQFNNQLLAARFQKNNINPSIVSTVSLTAEDVTTEKERGGFGLGFIIPLIIVMWSIVGGQYIAIDVSAGEKERKTLEALLMTPVSRLQIVFGKFLAVSTAAMISVIASLGSLYYAIKQFGFGSAVMSDLSNESAAGSLNLDFSVEPQALILMFIVSIFLCLMFSAIILSIAIFAKSFKEAQSYISPAYIIAILPATFLNSMPGFKPTLAFFAVPAVNAMLLFKEVLMGVYDYSHIILTLVTLAIYSLIAIVVASYIYSKESILVK